MHLRFLRGPWLSHFQDHWRRCYLYDLLIVMRAWDLAETRSLCTCICNPLDWQSHMVVEHMMRSRIYRCSRGTSPLLSPPLHAYVWIGLNAGLHVACSTFSVVILRWAGILNDEELGVELVIGEPLYVSQPAAIFDDTMEYARLVAELEATESMSTSRIPHLAALNGAIGRDMIARLHSAKNLAKLERKLLRFERRLGIAQCWTPEHPQFKVRGCLPE